MSAIGAKMATSNNEELGSKLRSGLASIGGKLLEGVGRNVAQWWNNKVDNERDRKANLYKTLTLHSMDGFIDNEANRKADAYKFRLR